MTSWLTDDTHFGHKNIIGYFERPYSTLDQMNWDLMRRWNEVVGPDDAVYHLGDFAMGNPDTWPEYRAALNGRIVLNRGNYDRHLNRVIHAMDLADVVENAVIEIDGTRCWVITIRRPPTTAAS